MGEHKYIHKKFGQVNLKFTLNLGKIKKKNYHCVKFLLLDDTLQKNVRELKNNKNKN